MVPQSADDVPHIINIRLQTPLRIIDSVCQRSRDITILTAHMDRLTLVIRAFAFYLVERFTFARPRGFPVNEIIGDLIEHPPDLAAGLSDGLVLGFGNAPLKQIPAAVTVLKRILTA